MEYDEKNVSEITQWAALHAVNAMQTCEQCKGVQRYST